MILYDASYKGDSQGTFCKNVALDTSGNIKYIVNSCVKTFYCRLIIFEKVSLFTHRFDSFVLTNFYLEDLTKIWYNERIVSD